MRDVLLTAFIIGCLPVALFRPIVGLYLFAWVSYMNPHRLTWSFAFEMPFAAMAAAATVLGIVITRRIERPPLSPAFALWLCWMLWVCITTVFALEPGDAQEQWVKFMKIQFMTFCTLLLVQSAERIKWLVWIIVASIAFYGIKGGIFTITKGGESRVWGPPGGFFEGNNELALTLLVIIPLLFFLYRHTINRWVRWGIAGAVPLCMLSVIASYSRGAFLALAALGMHFVWKSKHKMLMLPVLAVLAVGTFSVMPDKYWDRVGSIQNFENDGSAMGRINAWWFAFNLAKDRPAVGGGLQAFTHEQFERWAPNPDDHHDAHSIYFQVLGEHGFVGLGIFLGMFAAGYFAGGRTRRLARRRNDLAWAGDLAMTLQTSMVAFAVGGAFLGMAYYDLFYHILALQMLTLGWVRRELATTTEPAGSIHTRVGSSAAAAGPLARPVA